MGMKSSDEPFVRFMDHLRCAAEKKDDEGTKPDNFTFSSKQPRSFVMTKKLYSACVL